MAGYEVHTMRNGVEAVAALKIMRPDAMVLDINMPEMDGFGVLEAIKAAGIGRIPTWCWSRATPPKT